MPEARIYHNPRCSKSRAALQLLEERGLKFEVVLYLEKSVEREEILFLYEQLGLAMLRTQEPLYRELQLAEATPEQLLDALEQHPILIERPLVIVGKRAVVARPAELALKLFELDSSATF